MLSVQPLLQVLGILERRSGQDSFQRILEASVSAACLGIAGLGTGVCVLSALIATKLLSRRSAALLQLAPLTSIACTQQLTQHSSAVHGCF